MDFARLPAQVMLLGLALALVPGCAGAPCPPPAAGPPPAAPPASHPPEAVASAPPASEPVRGLAMEEKALLALEQKLVEKHGAAQTERIRRGLRQAAERWRAGDGDGAAFAAFAEEHFLSDPASLADTARHLEYALEMLDGHSFEIERELSRFQELDEGTLRPVDPLLGAYSMAAHINEDLYGGKVAFVVLLNFPVATLEQRLTEGKAWSRDEWAMARLAGRVEHRLPAEVLKEIERASSAADRYIDSYNIYMDRLAGPAGPAGFPAGKKLISHWGLRDEIRALYAQKGGLERQRLIARVMERITRQEIPAEVIDAAGLEWDPERNLVRRPGSAAWEAAAREPDTRYERLLAVFRANRRADPYFPALPTHIVRTFERDREIPEARVRALLESVLLSETAKRVGALIRKRLGRPLEPFDVWYAGFRPQSQLDETKLDRTVRERYPAAPAFQQDIPRILAKLGFAPETARFLAERIAVDPARGAGHAAGAKRRDDKAHLRTRIVPGGMDYKGFNIAIHELGHNVEQVFSMSRVDHTLLEGVPNTGFTEAFAFLFQARDLELLGEAGKPSAEAEALRALDRFWSAYEIAGVALIDTEIWHWLYDHPAPSAAELREATVKIARQIWDRYYAPVFGVKGQPLLAIYSHIIAYGLYTPDYPLGFLISAQVEAFVRTRDLATEMERMCRLGRLAPDVWMQQAVGQDVSSAALLQATEAALGRVGG